MIIGLIGQKRVGKDTVAGMIKDISCENGIEYNMMALADPIKQIAKIMFNFTENQLYNEQKDEIDENWNIKPRHFFEQFGTEIMQFDIYKYLPSLESVVPKRKFWVLSLLSKIKKTDNIIITDIRGQHELEEIIKFNPNSKFIQIIKPTLYPDAASQLQHPIHITQQEPTQINEKFINEIIINDGTLDDLKQKVKIVIEKIQS